MDSSPHPNRIVCSNLPEGFDQKSILKEHFSQFGKVSRVHFRPKSKTWMLEFETEESAESAVLQGGEYMGQVFDISWDHRKRKTKNDPDPDWLPDPDVQKELEAMGYLGDSIFKLKYNTRPEEMAAAHNSLVKEPKPSKPDWKPTVKRKSDIKVTKMPIKKNGTEKINSTEQLTLLNILKQPTLTSDDKFKLLDARDKLIRLKTKKLHNIAQADHLVGTCPDMCPEKERLMREIQHQVAMYEQDDSGRGMNPVLAVKAYSRSSADQEVPLPHELRPVGVLQFTMGYLMRYIMNLCDSPDVNIAEWYHFLWDRTRSIRKDITQQALCCQGSVLLLEQCARFHIHCSAYLIAEDLSTFDPKINTENLTKCLQTLKYMYHDLHIKGESCPNEAEFRAYIILLNLNDGNFMWEVQQLKLEIQKSPEVRFALNVYSALSKTNYVKFFKLMHSTTYLNACILMQYFMQVRTKALSILVRCYSPRASYTQFSLTELEDLLAFEDTESVRDFISSFGLLVNETNTHVTLDRTTFIRPLIPRSLDRAIKFVESKRQSTVGEVVCGDLSALSLCENYTPHSSFNESGCFILTEPLKSLIEVDEPDMPAITKSSTIENAPKPFWSNKPDSVKSVVNIFGSSKPKQSEFTFKIDSVTSQMTTPVFSGALFTNVENPRQLFDVSVIKSPPEGIFGSNVTSNQFSFNKPSIFTETQPVVNEQDLIRRRIEEEEMKLEQELNKQRELELAKQIELEKQRQLKLERQKQLELEKQKQLELERLKKLEQQKRLEIEAQRLLEVERLKQLEVEKQKRIEYEKQLRIQQELQLKKKQIEEEKQRQQQLLLLKEKERKLNEEIQASVQQIMEDLLTKAEKQYKEERLKEISDSIKNHKLKLFLQKWHNRITVRKKKRQAIDQNPIFIPCRTMQEETDELFTVTQKLALQNIKRYKMGHATDIRLPDLKRREVLDISHLHKVLASSYARLGLRAQTDIFWKLTVSLPDIRESYTALSYVENVLTDFFGWKDRYGTTVVVGKHETDTCFHYSIEKKQEAHMVDGNSNGFLFIMNEISDVTLQRISSSFGTLPNKARLPIACVIIDDNNTTVQKLRNMIETNKRITSYTISSCTYVSLIDTIKKSLEFLTKWVEKPPPLEIDLLRQFLKAYLGAQLWKKVSSYSAWNGKYRKCLKFPSVVIDIYNEAVEKLKNIIVDDFCFEYQDFCDDFELTKQTSQIFPCSYRYFPPFWKTLSYRKLILATMDVLKLPTFNDTWPPDTLNDLENSLINYLSEVFDDSSTLFYNVLSVFLRNIDVLSNFCDIKNASWVDVVEVLALAKLDELDFSLRHTEFHTKSVFQELIIVYDVFKLEAYNRDEWFYLKNAVGVEIRSEKRKKKQQAAVEFNLDEVERSLRKKRFDDSFKQDEVTGAVKELGVLMSDLEESMKIHKSVCACFQRTFNTVVSTSK